MHSTIMIYSCLGLYDISIKSFFSVDQTILNISWKGGEKNILAKFSCKGAGWGVGAILEISSDDS